MRLKRKQRHGRILSADASTVRLVSAIATADGRYRTYLYNIPVDVDVDVADSLGAGLIDVVLLTGSTDVVRSLWRNSVGSKIVMSSSVVDDIITLQQTLKSSNNANNVFSTTRIAVKAVTALDRRHLHGTATDNRMTRHSADIEIDGSALVGCQKFHVIVRLVDAGGVFIDVVEFDIEHGHMLTTFETPTIPPSAVVTSVADRTVIDVKQADLGGSMIKVYRRHKVQSADNSERYQFIADVRARVSDGYVRFTDRLNDTSLYRFIPVGSSGVMSRTFTDVEVNRQNSSGVLTRKHHPTAAFTVERSDAGALVALTNVSSDVVAIALLRRHAGQGDFAYILDSVKLTASDASIRFTDESVRGGRSYEYRLMLYMTDGTSVQSLMTAFYEHITGVDVGVQINVTDPVITHVRGSNDDRAATYDVTFSITSIVKQSQDDILYAALNALGVADVFVGELDAIRDNFAKLVAHGVKRVNLNTGYVEDFGVITAHVFSDIEHGRRRAVTTLAPGVNYRYLITTYVRTPEALFDGFTKVKTASSMFDASVEGASNLTTASYTLRPSKSLHPSVARTGAISTATKRSLLHARDELSYGALGNIRTIDVTIPTRSVNVTSVNASKVGQHSVIVTWHITGDPSHVDHFVISCMNGGIRYFVAVAHALDGASTFEYRHDVASSIVGSTMYSVLVISSNLVGGQPVEATEVVI
jgi:hypothetical protein